MTISDQIRFLAEDGIATAEIAKRLGIRYQHVYNVLKNNKIPKGSVEPRAPNVVPRKPILTVGYLVERGFIAIGRWKLSQNNIITVEGIVPVEAGVYAFSNDEIVNYVGVATMGLRKRIYFYHKPGITQRTSLRLNSIIRAELELNRSCDIYAAFPPDLEWNGLPVHGAAGLELGLIKSFDLPWNKRSGS